MTAECSNCEFSAPTIVSDGPIVECRRYPPQVFVDPVQGDAVQAFPNVGEHDWCGEHKPRPE